MQIVRECVLIKSLSRTCILVISSILFYLTFHWDPYDLGGVFVLMGASCFKILRNGGDNHKF